MDLENAERICLSFQCLSCENIQSFVDYLESLSEETSSLSPTTQDRDLPERHPNRGNIRKMLHIEIEQKLMATLSRKKQK